MDEQGRPTLDAEQLLAVLDGVPVLLYVQDPESRIIYINQSAPELVGRLDKAGGPGRYVVADD